MSVTASSGWRADELSAIDGCGGASIATRRSDGTLRAARVAGVVFVEVGTHAGEGSGLDNALDAAYRAKYGRSSSAVARITADVALRVALA
jgi:hypothetical protein